MSATASRPGMTEAVAELVGKWADELPASRYVNVDGTAENARVSVRPDEAIELATRAYRLAESRMVGRPGGAS